MLVLTRKTNQTILIGDEIEITVLAVSRDKVRIGISAPRDVPVFRKEVLNGEAGDADAAKHVDEALGKLAGKD